MQNKLTYLIREEIDRRYNSTKEVSDKLRNLQRVYNALIPNKNKKDVINMYNLTEDLFFEFIELIQHYNGILYSELLKLTIETKEYDKRNTPKCDFNVDSSILALADRRYNTMIKNVKDELEVVNKVRDFFAYAVTYFVELYERLEHEKETKKQERKVYEQALKNLSKNRFLTPKEINAITSLIERQEQSKNEYYEILNGYIRKKDEEAKVIDEKEEKIKFNDKKNPVVFRDEENKLETITKESRDDNLILNYLRAINTFQDDEKNLTEFLDGISYNEEFDEILNKLIIILSENSDNNLLNYLKKYKEEFKNSETIEELLEEDSLNDEITLLYYGFLQGKETILNEIEKTIPREDYKDVLKALEQIKIDGAKSNRKNIVRIRKVFKLRVGNIRVSFKRISKNVYIVLGVYRKKDNHGAEIIYSTERRNNHLLRDENQIIESMKINDLWDLYLEKNSGFEENIFTLLKQNTYQI